ncbi:hypothetical protein INR49_012204 [Caranx melampygus]|nr:hypothetical protein INR49_012204 [Caranx melampygus]
MLNACCYVVALKLIRRQVLIHCVAAAARAHQQGQEVNRAAHLVRSAAAFRWRSGRQRHPGVLSGTASSLTTRQPASEALPPLPDGLQTLRAERLRTEINRGEEPGGESSPEQEREGTWLGEERSAQGALRCRQTGPRTPTD